MYLQLNQISLWKTVRGFFTKFRPYGRPNPYGFSHDFTYRILDLPDKNSIFLKQPNPAHLPSLFHTPLGGKKGERVVAWLVSDKFEMYQDNGRYCISPYKYLLIPRAASPICTLHMAVGLVKIHESCAYSWTIFLVLSESIHYITR